MSHNEYQPKGGDALRLGSKSRYGSCVGGRKTVWSHCYTLAISERFRDNELICKALIKFSCLLFFYFFTIQWRRYTRARQVKWPGWKMHRPGSALPSPAYCFASVIVWTENKNVTLSDRFICFILSVKRRWRSIFWGWQLKRGRQLFLRKKVHPGDLAGGFSDLEMTWLLYCAGAATELIQKTDERDN